MSYLVHVYTCRCTHLHIQGVLLTNVPHGVDLLLSESSIVIEIHFGVHTHDVAIGGLSERIHLVYMVYCV
jgi:hypothetical protein